MIRFEALGNADSREWDRGLELCPTASVYHSSSWLRFLELTQGGELVQARILENGSLRGFFCGRILRRYGLRILGSPLPGWTTHYMGPALLQGVSAGPELVEALDRWVFGELRCDHFEFLWRDADPAPWSERGYEAEELPSFLIDLREESQRIFSRFNSACRWRVHKAEREGLTVEESGGAGFLQEYYDQLQDVFEKQGIVPTYPRSRVEKLLEALDADHLLTVRVLTPQRECAATVIVTRDRHSGYLWGAASWRKHQKLSPNELIQWRLMLRLKELGVEGYDFGGGGAYKSKFGGAPVCTPWFFKSRNRALRGLRVFYRGVFRGRQRLEGLRRAFFGGKGSSEVSGRMP